MGLLDDAIREHLELKRLRGAEPGEVARQERDVLGLADGEPGGEDREEVTERGAPEGDALEAASPVASSGQHAGQETVEFDMEDVLDESGEHDVRPNTEDEAPAATSGRSGAGPEQEDSLEWEMPDDEGQAAEDIPLTEEGGEDVLEETPDFLRETPEQDRLWFEQRPPRDFDFNE